LEVAYQKTPDGLRGFFWWSPENSIDTLSI
jgi:hypothetical protein